MCRKWCYSYTKCPHKGKLHVIYTCLEQSSADILVSAGLAKDHADVKVYRESCEKQMKIDEVDTYGACDQCLRDLLAERGKADKEPERAKGEGSRWSKVSREEFISERELDIWVENMAQKLEPMALSIDSPRRYEHRDIFEYIELGVFISWISISYAK